MSELEVQEITKDYPTRSEPVRVLRGVSFVLRAGEALAIMGPSGSGKSTLLQILGTLDQPSSGRLKLDGQDPSQLTSDQQADLRGQRIGFVFQDHYLLPQLSALENVVLPALAGGSIARETLDRGRQLLSRVGLAERMHHRPWELSGGERQRVALARALILGPRIVLADEPTGNLDQEAAANVADILCELQQTERVLLVLATHSPQLARRFGLRRQLVAGRLAEIEERG
jgi:lipoprotein-releasing system ATP-binding protein